MIIDGKEGIVVSSPVGALRKRRTRQHVIADQAVNHVERFIIDEGHVPNRPDFDYGYDLELYTFDESGFPENGLAFFQIKASENWPRMNAEIGIDLDIRDVNMWRMEIVPVFVVIFEASSRQAFWIDVQACFPRAEPFLPRGRKTVRVKISIESLFDQTAVREMRRIKNVAANSVNKGRQ